MGGEMTLSFDLEWGQQGIDVLGLAFDEGKKATAIDRNEKSLGEFLQVLRQAERIAGQNVIDADIRQMELEGIKVDDLLPKIFDIRVAFHLINSHLAGTGSFDIRSIVLLCGAKQGYRFPLDWKKYESDLHATCAVDAAAVSWCVPTLERQIAQHKLENVLDVQHKCARIFSLMKTQGVKLDQDVLNKLYQARKKKSAEIIEKYHLWEERGKKVIKRVPIWRSNKVLDVFEAQFGIRPLDRRRVTWEKLVKSGKLNPEALEFAEAIMDLGKGANDAHWLGDASEDEAGEIDFSKVSDDGFIYPRYDICGSPDRAIAAGPNIQNFPRPSDDPRDIKLRSAVIPLQEDHVILGVDLASVEVYTTAIEADDWEMVAAIQDGRISHQGTADVINKTFGLSLDRNAGKACNHANQKGESPYNLARRLFGSDRPSRQQTLQCENIIRLMLKDFPKTTKFRDDLWERSIENPLVVINKFGRRLLCFSRAKYGDSNDRFAKHNPYRKYWCSCSACGPRRDRWKYALAFLGRSSAFDVLLRVMAKIYYENLLDTYSLPMLEVHDELDYSVPKDDADRYGRIAKAAFEEPVDELGGIALPSSVVIGNNWLEAH